MHFVDDDSAADRQAEATLGEIARAVGFKELSFQYEPIAAAFHYETSLSREEVVLVADIGGGTSDFSIVRLSPERARAVDRWSDVLANDGIHIGGTDFDKQLSLAEVMPLLGYRSQLKNGREMPASVYFNLATWHTINFAYTRQVWTEQQRLHLDASSPEMLERLLALIRDRAGHWLAHQVEQVKIALSHHETAELSLERLPPASNNCSPAANSTWPRRSSSKKSKAPSPACCPKPASPPPASTPSSSPAAPAASPCSASALPRSCRKHAPSKATSSAASAPASP